MTGQPQITREDLKQMVAVTGRISGRDMGSTIRDVSGVLDQPGLLPAGRLLRARRASTSSSRSPSAA